MAYWRSLLAFETGLQMRGVGFWLAVVLLFVFGLSTTSFEWFAATGDTGARIKADSPFMLALLGLLAGLVAIFFAGVFVVNGAMRDDTHGATEIIHATPITTPAMQGARLAGVVLAVVLATGAILLGAVMGTLMPWADREALGAFTLAGLLAAFATTIVVNAVLLSAIFALVAGITRSRMAVYIGAVVAFLIYTAIGTLDSEDLPRALRALMDPLGGIALALDTELWSPAEQNTRLPPLDGWYGLNRLVYLGVGLAMMVAAFALTKRGIVARRPGLFSRTRADDAVSLDDVPTVRAVATRAPGLQAFLVRVRYEVEQTVRSAPFLILLLVMFALSGLVIVVASAGLTADRSLATNANIAEAALGGAGLPLLLLTVFFAGDIVWRERQSKIYELVDSARASNLPIMAGKWAAMVIVLVLILAALAVFSMVAQLVVGDVALEPGTHIAYALLPLPRFVVLAMFVMFLQNFLPSRMVGMIVGGAAIGALLFAVPQLPFYHPLMNLGGISLGGFSEMLGFGNLPDARWTGVYWGGLMLVFAVASIWLWRRGTQTRLVDRMAGVRDQMGLVSTAVLGAGLIAFIGGGIGIGRAYEASNFRTSAENEQLAVDYERDFGDRFDAPVPKIRSVDADVIFRPSRGTASVSGTYRVENTTGAPLSELFISYDEDDMKDGALVLDIDGARLEQTGRMSDYGLQRAVFEPPLAPGAAFDVGFDIEIAPPRFANGSPIDLNGTFVDNGRLFPSLGVPTVRLTNPDKRRKYDLPERPRMASQDDEEARLYNVFDRASDRVDFATRFCTDADQIPVAPGEIVRDYSEGDLRCREFRAAQPITNFFAFTSGRYALAEGTYTRTDGSDVALTIYYDPQHDYNTELMLDAMVQGLTTFEREFGRYPHSYARIIEFPFGGFAQSFPGTIPFSENIGFVRDPGERDDDESIDFATYVTQHELGHQWFGHLLLPANTMGFNVISESLTEHAAMLAYTETYGPERARLIHERRNVNGYLMGRVGDQDDEPPLVDTEGQSYLFYPKGAWVMWGLTGYLGADTVNAALRDLIAEYSRTGPPYVTTHQLVDALRERAGPDYDQLITDYWERLTFWDFEVEDAAVNGNTVTFTLLTDKLIASEESGEETSVSEIEGEALDEWVQVALYADDPRETGFTEPMAIETVRVTDTETGLTLSAPEAPTHLVIDPNRYLIERDYDDNVVELPGGADDS